MRAWMPLLLLAASAPALSALPSGISGAWYNPAQSGHGFSVEILSDERALVFWYTYDNVGAPLTLYIEGRIEGQSIVGNALAPSGMRFGDFRREDLVVHPWGTLRIDFTDCDHGTVHFDANDVAYGEGQFPLHRLTRIKDSTCALAFPSRLATGLYKLRETNLEWHVAVDDSGIMHGVTTAREVDGIPSQGHQISNAPSTQFEGTPRTVPSTSLVASYELAARLVTWQVYGGGVGAAQSGVVDIDASGHSDEILIPSPGGGQSNFDFDGTKTNLRLQPNLALSDLAGTYRFKLVRFFALEQALTIGADGSLCQESACGRIALDAQNEGFFEFTLPDTGTPNAMGGDYRGVGWLEIDAATGSRELVLTGQSTTETIGVVARKTVQ